MVTSTAILPNAGVPPPLPVDFDFDARRLPEENVIPPAHFSLSRINKENCIIEVHNEQSLEQTDKAEADSNHTTDIGLSLRPIYKYTEADLRALLDETYKNAVGPIPSFLLRVLLDIKQQDKDDKSAAAANNLDEKKASRLTHGSLRMEHPIIRNIFEKREIPIPDIYQHSVIAKAIPCLHWCSSKNLEFISNNPHSIHTKTWLAPPTATFISEKITILDIEAMIKLWGSDFDPTAFTPLQWLDASKNMLRLLQLVSNEADKHSYATEYEMHMQFFEKLADFEAAFSTWYHFERKSRLEIFQDTLFHADYYQQSMATIFEVHHQTSNRRLRSDSTDIIDTRSHKSLRISGYQNTAGSQESGNRSFRANTRPDSQKRQPTCLICLGKHSIVQHDNSTSSFIDGGPFFAAMDHEQLVTAQSARGSSIRRICIGWNLNKCNRPLCAQAHICSLCGGKHTAFSRDGKCARVSAGAFVP
jgi:hypothetical protein